MLKKYSLIARVSLLVLMLLNIVFLALVFFGGENDPLEVGGELLSNPAYTDAFMIWMYILTGIAICVTLVLSLIKFVKSFINNPAKGIKTLCVLCAFVGVIVVSWFLGSGDEMQIIGYEGTDNVGFWAQYSDMCIISTYILLCAAVLSLVGTIIYSKIKPI